MILTPTVLIALGLIGAYFLMFLVISFLWRRDQSKLPPKPRNKEW